MLPRTKINVLLQIRADIIRDGLEGLEHVNALLVLRGVDPASQHVRRKAPLDRFRQCEVRRFIKTTLGDGPMRRGELATILGKVQPHLSEHATKIRCNNALQRLQRDGFVARGKCLWWLTPPVANTPPNSD